MLQMYELWAQLAQHVQVLLCYRPEKIFLASVSHRASAEIWSCNDAAGFYWDELLRKCIKCSDVCGQHPQQCSEICHEKKCAAATSQLSFVGHLELGTHHVGSWILTEITSSNQDSLASLRHCLPHEEHFNIRIFMILAVSLCVITYVFLMLLVCCMKKRGVSTCDTAVSSHKTNVSSKDRLLQLGVEGEDQNQSISSEPSSSEPSETCSYCFSEQRVSDKERKLLSTPHQCIPIPSAADTRALPSATVYKEKPFQIICSPSQPSTKETESFLEKCHLKY
ncbi:tumor necrosis factor receptor superfamily member 13B [Heptranchias perlo]|uniref:tumor necrosis factor receptor superfamily member 13B n=1 Tax=Heptranchias perlo TaxID=212740 RepID=UPI003559D63C